MKFLLSAFRSLLSRFVTNRYEAAAWSPTRSWLPGSLATAREDISKYDREGVVVKSRYFEKESDLYNKLADLWEQYTVGTGLQFYATSSDEKWNKLADGAWEKWKPFADISSRFHFDTLQGVLARAMFVDGEVFVILTKGQGNRARIQILEGPLCKTPDSLKSREGKDIIDGIRVDANGRPEEYFFVLDKDKPPVSFPAFAVEHLFEPSRPGQMRGLPPATCALNTLHDLFDLHTLEMQCAKMASEIANVETNAAGELDATANRRSRLGYQPTGAEGTASTRPTFADYNLSIGGKNIGMKTGDKLDQFMITRPTVVTQAYWTKLEEKVCSGAGTPLVMVYPDSMQGTVYRGSLDAAAAFYRCKSAVIAGFIRRIREFVLNAEGAIFTPLANRPPDWQSADYQPPAAPNTDVGYNSAAAIADLKAGIKNWDDILLPQGRKAETVLRRKAALQVMIKKLAAEFSKDGITITPEEIANIDITPLPGGEAEDDFPPPKRGFQHNTR